MFEKINIMLSVHLIFVYMYFSQFLIVYTINVRHTAPSDPHGPLLTPTLAPYVPPTH